MRAALDNVRAARVLVGHGPGSALLAEAIPALERALARLTLLEAEDAARRAFGEALRERASRHVPVLSPADAVARSVRLGTQPTPDLVQHVSDRDPA